MYLSLASFSKILFFVNKTPGRLLISSSIPESSTFWQHLKDFYNKYILKEEIETIWGDTLYYRVQKLHNVVKEFLDMQAKGYEYAGYLGDNK